MPKTTPTISKTLTLKTKTLNWPSRSAARLLTNKIPLATADDTLASIRARVIDHVDNFDTINYIYIISPKGRLTGTLSIRELLKHSPETKVAKVMTKKLIKAHPKTNKNELAHIAIKNSLKAVPIVDQDNNLLGVISADKIQSVLHRETQQNFLRLAGILPKNVLTSSNADLPLLTSFLARLPWILVGLIGGLVAAQIIDRFSPILESNLILASFIPLVAYLANAVGVQTQTLFIRDLTTNGKIDFARYLVRQTIVTLLIGIVCLLTIVGITAVIWGNAFLGLVIGISVLVAVLISTVFALLIPQTLNSMKIDPAIGSGPFATIIQDLLSIISYFLIASLLI